MFERQIRKPGNGRVIPRQTGISGAILPGRTGHTSKHTHELEPMHLQKL
jgi:hypothetical protein